MNIVFDLGGVVLDWRPQEILERVFETPRTRELVRAEILGHPDWIELDRGTLDLEEAVHRGATRTGLPSAEIRRLFDEMPCSLTPIDETIDLIRSIVETDNRLFVLSNIHHASYDYVRQQHDFWDVFDGIVASCRIQMVKPEIRIYKHLLNRFGLEATETVFIDDMDINLAAAASIGIHTIKFEDASRCRRELELLKRI